MSVWCSVCGVVWGSIWVCVLSCFSRVWPFVTPWTVACQALLSMGFSRQEDWSGLPGPSPGDLPHPGMEASSLKSLALVGRFFTTSAIWEARIWVYYHLFICSGKPIYEYTTIYLFVLGSPYMSILPFIYSFWEARIWVYYHLFIRSGKPVYEYTAIYLFILLLVVSELFPDFGCDTKVNKNIHFSAFCAPHTRFCWEWNCYVIA